MVKKGQEIGCSIFAIVASKTGEKQVGSDTNSGGQMIGRSPKQMSEGRPFAFMRTVLLFREVVERH